MASRTHSDLAYLCRALKAPSLAAAVERLGERARAENWSHEEFLAACLEREVSSRADHGGENRIRAARFPARKTIDDFDLTTSAPSSETSSPTSAPSTSSRPGTTWSSSALQGRARPICPSLGA